METIVHHLTLAMLFTDDQRHCTALNLAAERLTGYTCAEVAGRPFTDILDVLHLHDADTASISDPFALVLQHHQRVWGEAMVQCKDGAQVPVTFTASAIHDCDCVIGMSIELWNHPIKPIAPDEPITQIQPLEVAYTHVEREQALAALEIERAQLAMVFAQAPAAIAMMRGPDHRFEMANPLYYQLIGQRDILGKTVLEALPELAAQGFVALLDSVYRTGTPFVAHHMSAFVQRTPDGPPEECIVNFVYQPLFEATGAVSGILAHVVDVTAWMHAQQQQHAVEVRYQRFVATVPQTIYVLDAEGILLEVNPAGEQLLGRPSTAIVGHDFREFIAPEDVEPVLEAFRQVVIGVTDTIAFEMRILRPSGERRLIHATVTAISTHGQITGLHGIARDITDERAQDERMRLLSLVLEQLEQGVSLMDKDLFFRYANPAAKRMLGIPFASEELVHVTQLLPDAAAQRELTTILTTLHETGQWSGRVRRKRLSDGQVMLFDMVKGTVMGTNGERLYFNLFQDASHVIERERQFRRTERLASLGTLIGGVAHELNNPLTTIINLCELLLLEPRSGQDQDDLQTIFHEAKRMARIVADLRLSARHTQEHTQTNGAVDLNAVVQHALKVRAYTLQTRTITVQTDLADDLPMIAGDQGALEQVVLNLIVNAEQAMQTHAQERRLMIRTRRTLMGASVTVIDTGCGIDPAHLERIFDPFFTTKAPGEGMGLGLALVHSLIEEHGGRISVQSVPGSGTTMRVDLRALSFTEPTPPHGDAEAPVTPLRILVVDDEAPIRDSIARFLRQRGHQVEVASDGREALQLLDTHTYDCILSDLRMPGMSGEQLLAAVRQRNSNQRLIFVTGDAASPEAARVLAETDVHVLLKPIMLWEVAQTIEAG